MADPEQRYQQMLASLKGHGCRITPQRLAVLRVLAESHGHPSVEDIFAEVRREFPTTSRATVYKTVAVLKELHEVLELGFPDGKNRYDGKRPAPHPHVICTQCRLILDPDIPSLPSLTDEVAGLTGFELQSQRLDFFGLCPACRKKQSFALNQ